MQVFQATLQLRGESGGKGRGALLSMSLPRAVLMRTLNTDTGRELHTSEIGEMARESDQSLQSYHYVQYP